ncbi:MAG TPA: rhomboid family intramembrane serine protease [Anaerolineae bacterium]
MDLNLILLIIIGFAAALTGLRVFYLARGQGWGWIIISSVTLGAMMVSFFVVPDSAGYVGGVIWGALVWLPSMGARWLNRLVFQQRYRQARQLAGVLAWLHPADGWREQPHFLRALEFGQQGDFAEAEAILNRYQNTTTPLGRLAAIQLYRMNGRWDALLDWFEPHLAEPGFQHDPGTLNLYLRALGETGNLNGLLTAYTRFEKAIEKNPTSALLSRLVIFAFCGRVEQVARLFEGSLKLFSLPAQNFWLATANLTAGNETTGRQQLTEALRTNDILIRAAAERRQSKPLPLAEAALTPDSRAILAEVELAQAHAERYGGLAGPRRARPYLTYTLIGLNLVVFLVEIMLGGSQDIETLYRMGALLPQAVAAGEWWRLYGFMFLHFGFLHLLLNMLGLYALGNFVEPALGLVRYSLVYFVSGLSAGLLVVFLVLQGQAGNQILVGASGGIMGLVGATAAILLRGWRVDKARVASQRLLLVGLIIILQVSVDLLVPQISFTAHSTGLVTGFILTSLMRHELSLAN